MTMATSYHGLGYGGSSVGGGGIHRRRTGSLGSLEGVDPNNLPEHHRYRQNGGPHHQPLMRTTSAVESGSLSNFFSQQKPKQNKVLPEDMQSCTSSVAQHRRWELEEQRKMLESKLMKLDRRQDRRKSKLKLQPGHTLDENTATTAAESSASSSHNSGEQHNNGNNSNNNNNHNHSNNGGSCTACLTKDKMVQKQLKELQQLRLENMKLRGIPLQVMKIVDDDDSTSSGGSGITNHVIATTPEEQYNLAVLNGEEQARQQEGESVKVENVKYDLPYPMAGFNDRTEGRRRATYTGPVHSLSPHLPHGKGGKLVFLDDDGLEDDVYEGDFYQGEMHGEGTYTWAETGNVYKGSFWHNLRHGKGLYTNEKYIYDGTFQYDKPHGNGKQSSKNNDLIYEGTWEFGKKKKKERSNNTSMMNDASVHSRRSRRSTARSKSPNRSSKSSRMKPRRSMDHSTLAGTDDEGGNTVNDDDDEEEGTVNTRRSSRKERKTSRRSGGAAGDDLKSTRSSKSKSKSSRKHGKRTSSSKSTDGGALDESSHREHQRALSTKSADHALLQQPHPTMEEEGDPDEAADHVPPILDTTNNTSKSASPTNRRRLRRKQGSVRSMGNTKPLESRRDLMSQGFTTDEDDDLTLETLESLEKSLHTKTEIMTAAAVAGGGGGAPITTTTNMDDPFSMETMDMNSGDFFNPFQK